MQCANCGKNLTPGDKFCAGCGHPADEKPKGAVCSACKQENLPGAKFCGGCGLRLG